MQSEEEHRPRPVRGADTPTVDAAADSLRAKQKLEGARKSYQENCESMQRVHISPRLGSLPVTGVSRAHVEALAAAMLEKKLSAKTVRNTLSFLHSVFEHAIEEGWCHENPVRRATRPGRRRSGDVAPDLQFLTVEELDAVLRAIPDEVVFREPKPTRKGRRGPSPPPPPDVLGPVLRVVILAAAMTGLRQSELLGLRWRHVNWVAQRIRARNTYVRGEHSEEGKSDLSTKRSVPMADRLARGARWLVKAHRVRRGRRSGLCSSADRQRARSIEGHQALQGSLRRCESSPDQVPRSAAHVRYTPGRFRSAAADDPGVHGACR